MVVDFDDFGCNHVMNDQCQSHDCRDKLDQLHLANPAFKVTLFAIPAEMTAELAGWCKANESWVELAVHGFFHKSNYECEKMGYGDFDHNMYIFEDLINEYFVKIFKAPGWQISDDCMKWLDDNGWKIADQAYNNDRRPASLIAYVNDNGTFYAHGLPVEAFHGHCWNCVGNGIYECYGEIEDLVKNADSFQFVSEVLA